MGHLEKEVRQRARKTDIQHAVLSVISAAGMLSVALIAPNAISALSKLGATPRKRHDEITRSAASRLRKKGLLKFDNGYYSLTAAGENILQRWEGRDYKIERPKKWDRKWRVVIFDIPEKKKGARDEVRRIISRTGFERLQDSVWVYPFDCEDVVGLLKTELGLGKNMLYMIVDQLENDRHLRTLFGL